MKKVKLFLNCSPLNSAKFKVEKVINTLDWKPGTWLDEKEVGLIMASRDVEVVITGKK